MEYKVIITTSGTGSRLKELTQKTNKALIDINGRPAIEYILDRYLPNVPLVVTIGYLGDQIKNYFAKKNRKIEFVEVNPYEGPGSSLGYSLLQTESVVQCPFIFHACDTIVLEDIAEPNRNWAAAFPVKEGVDVSQYRTHKKEGDNLIKINDKGVPGFNAVHIGLIGIKDYKKFWEILNNLHNSRTPEDTSLSDVHVIEAMLNEGISFESIDLPTWLDTGNLEALNKTIDKLKKD